MGITDPMVGNVGALFAQINKIPTDNTWADDSFMTSSYSRDGQLVSETGPSKIRWLCDSGLFHHMLIMLPPPRYPAPESKLSFSPWLLRGIMGTVMTAAHAVPLQGLRQPLRALSRSLIPSLALGTWRSSGALRGPRGEKDPSRIKCG